MECLYALVNVQDDNTVEIVQIQDVLSFDADKEQKTEAWKVHV